MIMITGFLQVCLQDHFLYKSKYVYKIISFTRVFQASLHAQHNDIMHTVTENTHLENVLDNPAVIPLEGSVISFSDIDADKIGIVLISLPIH